MTEYIAQKPVRFDTNYPIGAAIPGNVVDPKRANWLIASGRIQRAGKATHAPCGGAGPNPDGPAGAPESGYACAVCAKVCGTKPALAAHEKSHGKTK